MRLYSDWLRLWTGSVAGSISRRLVGGNRRRGPHGTCLNRDCISSKILIHCADVILTVKNAAAFGIHSKVEGIDWLFIVKRAFEEVDADAAMI